ncbi:hATC-domain-containing protein, partial [Ascobolus immersus RN42]
RYYNINELSPPICAAAILHPCLKYETLELLWPDTDNQFFGWKEKALRVTKDLWESEYKDRIRPSTPNPPSPQADSLASSQITAFTNPISEMIAKRPRLERHTDKPDELDLFLATDHTGLHPETNPLAWWIKESKSQTTQFPNLARMAVTILSIPPMSAEVERAFSSAKNQIDEKRSNLADPVIEAVECMKSWMKYLDLGLLQALEIEKMLRKDGALDRKVDGA